jgi:molecular chaperone IbpA
MTFATAHRIASPFVRIDRFARANAAGAVRNGATPYDLAKTGEDRYRLTLAVPGYGDDELEVETRDADLVVRAAPKPNVGDETVLHRGIARPAFERRFALGEHVRVDGARLADGLLRVELVREVPAALKPRTIAIDKAA